MQRFSFMEHLGCAEPRPQYPCDHTDCEHAEWEKDYLILCEGCGGRFCKDHVRKIGAGPVGDLDFCERCAKCEKVPSSVDATPCGDRADFTCDRCGALLCAGDARGVEKINTKTGETKPVIVCRGMGCATEEKHIAYRGLEAA